MLFGPCLRQLLLGVRPQAFSVLTPLAPRALLSRFPHAIPLHLERGILRLPTQTAPLTLHSLAAGRSPQDQLLDQDFTIHAIGWVDGAKSLTDPLGGARDLAERVLKTVVDARTSFETAPLRALRGARLCAQISMRPGSELLPAMYAAAPRLAQLPRAQLRDEFEALLLGPEVRKALDLLRRGGVEAALAPGVGDDAALVVERLPPRLGIRLAGWLRGTRAGPILRRLGQPSRRALGVESLLHRHPVDARREDPKRVSRLARLALDQRNDLFLLRAAEIEARAEGPQARDGLRSLEERVQEREREVEASQARPTLALDGVAVMEHLEIGPSARVGAALRHLAKQVADDPSKNEPEKLRAMLDEWKFAAGVDESG